MAVNFKLKNTTVATVFGYLEIPHEKMEKFQLFGLKLDLATDGIVVSCNQSDESVKISSTAVAISSLKSGKLGPTTSAYLKKALIAVIDKLPSHPSEWDGKLLSPEGVTATQADTITAKDHIAEVGPVIAGVEIFPMEKLHSAPLIKLRDATMMYQPVQGTGDSSRYWVIALSDAFKVAARWQNQTMSVRIEGKQVGSMAKTLMALGFNNVKADYASVHLQVGTDPTLANRTIGAIVASLSDFTAIKTPVPSAKVVKSK